MKFEEFEALVEMYGADPSRWPERQRADMQDIIQAHPEQANAILSAARELDDMLDVVPNVQASDLLKTRIQIMRPEGHNTVQPQRSQRRVTRSWTRLAAMIIVSFSAGFAGAQFVDFSNENNTTPTELVASNDTSGDADWAVAATELGFSEIYAWASGEDIDVTDVAMDEL